MDIRKFIAENILMLDGAMGTMLQQNGLKPGEKPEIMNMTHPETVKEVHRAYLKAGAKMVLTNTFGANQRKLSTTPYSAREVVTRAVTIAKEAAAEFGGLAALDISSIGELLEPHGTLRFNEAYALFQTQVTAGAAAGADAVVIETMTDLLEMKCALLAAKENSELPVFCTMSYETNMRTFMGVSLSSMALTLEGLGADAIGLNCSVGPAEMRDMFAELRRWTNLPLIAKPNAGLPALVNGETVFNITKEDFTGCAKQLLDLGVGIVGGCCGTTPDFISQLTGLVKDRTLIKRGDIILSAVCSGAETVKLDGVNIVGERINPTGKKRFQQALVNHDIDYITAQGIEQAEAGADILDVNVGFPTIDEKTLMADVVRSLQSVLHIPLQIDSSNPEVLEAALRIYNGKPIVNSVNGAPHSLKTVLPLVKKYGAMIIGLTLDENGIPKSAAQRCEIAEKIVTAALAHGIPRQNIIIDCLALTAGAEQESAYAALEAAAMVKARLHVKTVLGISNISFGLPARDKLNQVFLAAALANGLDLAIVNPCIAEMVDTVYCFRQLKNWDKGSTAYIRRFSTEKTPPSKNVSGKRLSIHYCVENGLKDEIRPAVKEILKNKAGLEVVNEYLIPALDKVGARYETGRIYLPQLLRSAEAAKAAFEVIKRALPEDPLPDNKQNNRKVLLATVKGDVHDIGKNIVKAVMENYGFDVIDLGKDVDIERVAEETVRNSIRLVGLSALMTTTVDNMEKTIQAIRTIGRDVKIVVGGAVLTEPLAKKIGADFYARDAMSAVGIARKVFG